jgi:hypothetical protein
MSNCLLTKGTEITIRGTKLVVDQIKNDHVVCLDSAGQEKYISFETAEEAIS